MLDVVLAFLVREDLEVAQLPDLLGFSFRNSGIAFLFLLRGSFPAVVGLRLDTILDPVQPVIQNRAMSELIGYVGPQRGEVGRLEGPLDLVLLLIMVPEKRRGELLAGDVAMLRRFEIHIALLEGCLGLMLR